MYLYFVLLPSTLFLSLFIMSKVDVRALTQAINYQPSNTNTFGLQWMMHLGQAASGRLLLQLLEVLPSVKSMEEPQIVARNYGCPAIHPPAVQKWTETVPCKDTVRRCIHFMADDERTRAEEDDKLGRPMEFADLEPYYFYYKEAGWSFTQRQIWHLSQVSTVYSFENMALIYCLAFFTQLTFCLVSHSKRLCTLNPRHAALAGL